MPLPQGLAGRRFGPLHWEATPRRILAYRAAMSPADADGLDDSHTPFLALPTQVATPEWLLTVDMLDQLKAVLPPEEAARGVHASQDTVFFSPIVADDIVETEAEILGVRPTRRGAVLASLVTTKRARDKTILSRTMAATVYRDVAAKEEGEVPSPPPVDGLAAAPVQAEIALDHGFAHIYSECAEIWNPIHTERRTARAVGLPDIIVHGTALWAKAGLALIGGGKNERRLRRLTARFISPVFAGEAAILRAYARSETTPYTLSTPKGVIAVAGRAEFEAA